MKLLYCTECHAIFNLTFQEKSCTCGRSKGKYLDNVYAVYSGPAIPFGIANSSFRDALKSHDDEIGNNFLSFVISKQSDTIEKTDGN